ncbi:two-component system, chemotaxis family, protein-glutamate methylesterase/glutaminase [Candidatus Magnetomoraceae bacterium gMMP-15]
MTSNNMEKQDNGFAGTLKNIQLSDLIQMCCVGVISMTIKVIKDSEYGIIFINDGEIVHAVCGNIKGEEAFYKILAWESGSFETLGASQVSETTIDKGWQYLLMEGARMADEQSVDEDESNEEKDKELIKNNKLKVLIVDDSLMMCKILENMLSSDKNMLVVGTAKNGEEALKKIDELKPDLITLDVNMPVMDGSTALKHIMIKSPCPVIIISKPVTGSHKKILDFLRLGAVDFINKPVKQSDMSDQEQELVKRVQVAAKAEINNFKRVKLPKILEKKGNLDGEFPCNLLAVINSGAGGYAELIKIIPLLPKNIHACIVVFQTMAIELLVPLADYLNQISKINIMPLEFSGDSDKFPLQGGMCYLTTTKYCIKLNSIESKSFYLENTENNGQEDTCFNIFFNSVAESFSKNVLTVLVSGADILDFTGLKKIKEKEGQIIIQQLSSCLVPHSLKKAAKAGFVDLEASPVEIARQILHFSKKK